MQELLRKIVELIVNPIILLGFVVATIFFFYAIIQLIAGSDGGDLEKKRKNVMYGIFGLFIMFSVYGILRLVLTTFNIPTTNLPF